MKKSVAAVMLAATASLAAAQNWPEKPVTLIVPFPPGGGNDILARAVGQRMAEILGQQVVIDNRGGAGGLVGGTLAAGSNPDGYTLFLGSMGGLAHNPALRPDLPYSPPRDFAAVSLLASWVTGSLGGGAGVTFNFWASSWPCARSAWCSPIISLAKLFTSGLVAFLTANAPAALSASLA